MYVCMHVCMKAGTHACIYVWVHVCMCVCVYASMHPCTYLQVNHRATFVCFYRQETMWLIFVLNKPD